jgi:DNA polymerase-3 subunit gamma/tau
MAESAGYQVVARRYRPQRFDELVGQEHVARGLSGAIESGRIGHAYLFTGARGVGKTSAARIYAKALECAAGPAAEPCNRCDACVAITAGQDVDVVEIDAASNRGVDEIRQLRQNVAVRPARGRFKIYIIDEVHMLTREAFNALLKTLEEPPSHVKFVLCTTEPDKLPITILSRCQRFDFQTVGLTAIVRRLAQIVEAEGAAVDPAALDLIARRAAGSMRDSQSLLEQLLGSSAGPIGVDEVHAVIGTGREERVGALVAALANRDAAAALAAFDQSLAGGADPGGVLEQVIAAFRDALLASVGCGPEALREGAGLGVDLAAIGRGTGTETILAMLQIIDQSLARMRTSGHAAVLAEMAIVRLANLENLDALSAAIDRVAAAGNAAPPAAPRTPPPAPRAPAPPPAAGATRVDSPAQPVPTPRPREKKTAEPPPAIVERAPPPRDAAADPGPGPVSEPPRRPPLSQAALIREATDHPLVATARTLFDAAIVKVEPPRRPPEAAPAAVERAGMNDGDADGTEPGGDADG